MLSFIASLEMALFGILYIIDFFLLAFYIYSLPPVY